MAAAASAWKKPLVTNEFRARAAAQMAAAAQRAANRVILIRQAVDRNMGNLPASVDINGTTWTRTSAQSQNGTYCYGSGRADAADIANNPHYTVVPASSASTTIYNVHYTIPNSADPSQTTRTYYYISENRWDPARPAQNLVNTVKLMVDKLFFTWVPVVPSSSASS